MGSACTLELLDADGKLIKRMPQFWGKVSHFAIVDGPDGSLNLLASRKYNGTNTVAIINNRTLDPNPRGFHSVPPGSTYVPGWSSMNRAHLFYEDLDDDGKKEVISETNGTWNRVTVWSESGQPLFDASFGPGERIPAKNMRDLEVADLDGDGTKEIVVATSAGLLVALDHECRKLWARRLASPPVLMKCITIQRVRRASYSGRVRRRHRLDTRCGRPTGARGTARRHSHLRRRGHGSVGRSADIVGHESGRNQSVFGEVAK